MKVNIEKIVDGLKNLSQKNVFDFDSQTEKKSLISYYEKLGCVVENIEYDEKTKSFNMTVIPPPSLVEINFNITDDGVEID